MPIKKEQLAIGILSLIILVLLAVIFMKRITPNKPSQSHLMHSMPSKENESTSSPIQEYQPKKFTLAGKVKGLSAKQINEHITLYNGYVKKRTEIEQTLRTVNRENSANRTYSPFRSLKIAETYALNGMVLHELYFENISPQITDPRMMGPNTKKFIEASYGSIENFKKDFFDCGGVARGWVVSCYVFDNGRIHNYVLDEHNIDVPMMVIPLLVLDAYEHAYMIDYGIDRPAYLDVFWNHIDWKVIEQRIKKWVLPLQNS